MKQTGKMRTLCVALALLMVLLSLPFATATALQLPAPTPVVRTSGGQAKLTDVDDPSIQYNSAYDLTAEIISESVDRLKDPLLAAISKLDWTAAGNILGEFIWDNFGDLQMWPDGTSKHAVYRSGTDPVPGYDELGYVAPKHSNIVKFNSNGGSSVPDQSVLNGGKAVPPATPTRNYDTFDGWYRDAALTALWDFATVVTGDITLYAKWINYAGYVVTFNSNGGSSVPSQAIEIGNTAAAPPAPTRAGYTFVAWYSNAALTALWDFATVVTGDITLYAKWNALPTTPPTTPTEPTTAKPVIPPALADAFSKLVAKLEKALTHVGSAFEKFFGGLGNQLEDAFFGIYDGTQDYIDKNGLKATQPDPDPAWDNLDTIAPAVYNFDYDWRLSPIDVADQLNDYIKAVNAYTHSDKVVLQALSAGNSVVLAYINKYVNGQAVPDVSGIMLTVSTANGLGIFGSVLQKKLLLDANALANATIISPLGNIDDKTHAILQTLYLSGVLDAVCSLLEFAPPAFLDALYDDAFIPCYGTLPGMWALVPPDMYKDAKKASFGAKVNDPAYADFFYKLDTYNDLQLNDHEILQAAAAKVKMGVITGYGLPLWPIGKNQGLQGDGVGEIVYSSFGATASPLGQTLGSFYKQKVNDGYNHISPDNEIDASTAALPNNTWFIKGAFHGPNCEWSGLFAWWYSTDNPTVFTSERWPQYLYAYGTHDMPDHYYPDSVYPLQTPIYEGSEKIAALNSLWGNILRFWNKLLYFLTGGTAGIFNGIAGLFK